MKYAILNYGFSFICMEDKVVLHNTNVWESHDFKNVISYDLCVQSLLKSKGLL